MTFNPVLIWFLIGLALVLSEFMIPGIILVFFGMGAWVVALTSWVGMTSGWTSQLMVFAVSSVLLLVLLRRWFRTRFFGYVGDEQNLEVNLDEFTGQVVSVTEDIHPDTNTGRVEFKGAGWTAKCDTPVAAGNRVIIEGVEGITLLVRPE